jgi:hypothetical protein
LANQKSTRSDEVTFCPNSPQSINQNEWILFEELEKGAAFGETTMIYRSAFDKSDITGQVSEK